MLIEVKERHIREGNRQSVSSCPVALAAREQHGFRADDIDVDRSKIVARDRRGRIRRYIIPFGIRGWIDTFDRGTNEERANLKPITFRARRS